MELMFFVLLVAIGLERLFELWLSARNGKITRSQGGVEVGQGHWPWMVLLHVAFFAAPLAEVWLLQRPFVPVFGYSMLALEVVAQFIRYWAITSLGTRWNVRVFVLPGAPAVVRGPYRFLRHPNYVAVVLEGLCVPLVHGAWLSALAFTLLNAWLLHRRITIEQQALAQIGTGYGRVGWKGRA